MSVYRFRVTFEDYDDVTREIEILSDQSFEDLHHCILRSILFVPDADTDASFFMSNDRWTRGQEIALEHTTGQNGNATPRMSDAVLHDFIHDPHQKIYYQFDTKAHWTFHVELVRILPSADLALSYPVCVKSQGEAPKQKTVPPVPKGGVPADTVTPELDPGVQGPAGKDQVDQETEQEAKAAKEEKEKGD